MDHFAALFSPNLLNPPEWSKSDLLYVYKSVFISHRFQRCVWCWGKCSSCLHHVLRKKWCMGINPVQVCAVADMSVRWGTFWRACATRKRIRDSTSPLICGQHLQRHQIFCLFPSIDGGRNLISSANSEINLILRYTSYLLMLCNYGSKVWARLHGAKRILRWHNLLWWRRAQLRRVESITVKATSNIIFFPAAILA